MLLGMLALALGLAVVLTRLPWWLSGFLLGVSLPFAVSLVALDDPARAVAPALLYAVALGLLVPLGNHAQRHPRAAPPRKRRRAEGWAQGGTGELDIPGYELLEKVGVGGMASVYRAKRERDGRTVALKIPTERYVADARFIRRFHREAEVAQRLDHANIVRTFEHGQVGARHYMVMEFVDGRSLESYIAADELDLYLSVEIMKLVVTALQHIHAAGIIHRDIKPANIMILRGGYKDGRLSPGAVKLMDFGIAGSKVLSRLTMTGARVGTPSYMSPEQAKGLKIDHRSDIYSLGLVLYEMLTGQSAFKGGYEAVVHQQIFQTPPPPRQLKLEIPKALDALVMRMIAKEADERPKLVEVYEILRRRDFQEGELPSRLVLAVRARQGSLRVLDTEGRLHASLGGEHFSAAPLAIAVDSRGHLYTAFGYRTEGGHLLHKLDPAGAPLLSFGTYGRGPGELLRPVSLATAPDDTVYVLDAETQLVQRFDPQGRFLSSFGGRGGGRGRFDDPRSVTVAPDGSVYVLDFGNRQVQRFDREGNYQLRWALNAQKEMRLLDGFAADAAGNLYIGDAAGGKIRKLTPKGKVALSYTLEALQGEAEGTLLDLGVDEAGCLYAARRGGHLIRKYDPSGRLLSTIETYTAIVQMIVAVETAAPVRSLE